LKILADPMAAIEERLLHRKFLVVDRHVFFSVGPNDQQRITEWIDKYGISTTQKIMGREYLSIYTRNPEHQSALGRRVQRVWQRTLDQSFGHNCFSAELINESGEWVLSVTNS
jgi:hypothetical protein